MSTQAITIRDAIISRLEVATALTPYGKIRRTPLPQAQPDDLPILSVFVMNEQSSRDGEGYPQFERSITIGVSVVRGFDDPMTLAGLIDADIALIENTLLTDPSFVGKHPQDLFESIEQMTCRRLFPQVAETYVCELRLEMTFRTHADFPPRADDDFEMIVVDTKPLDATSNTPLIRSEYDQDTD